MSWDFSTEPELEAKLSWMREFVRNEILPLEVADLTVDAYDRVTAELKQEVKDRGLWAAHLPTELGGGGAGQLQLALMHEILGMCLHAPPIFGNSAPDSGNAELLSQGGTDEQKRRWMDPLLAGELRSCFSMTEPGTASSDPTLLTTTAVRRGDEYVINGHKWFSSNASCADFFIVMAVTDPEAPPHRRASMIIVPKGTPGLEVVRDIPNMGGPMGSPSGVVVPHYSGPGEVIYRDVTVPADHIIGSEGDGFLLAQKRLGPGRIQHAMRWLGQARRAFDMMNERAVSRVAQGSALADKQLVQQMVAESAAELEAARLLTLQTAWKMDRYGVKGALVDISLIKFWGARVLYNTIDRALQVHGSLGFSADMPLERMYRDARAARIADGPDEIHKVTAARRILKSYAPVDVPTEHIPTRSDAARKKFAHLLDSVALNR
ncbi:acyl-CoA dehydrogenase family protein [Rhodococcus olei]|uniref:Acyl-CoA dehydrogenase family protein n=1 Tax=Rhodococcus olei TaxID=2161675 RepID=A0ABP8NYH1_9NOCA